MITIEFLGPIGKEPLSVNASTLSEIKEILKEDASLSDWLNNSAVALNDTIINSVDVALKDGDKISLLPPVCGG